MHILDLSGCFKKIFGRKKTFNEFRKVCVYFFRTNHFVTINFIANNLYQVKILLMMYGI